MLGANARKLTVYIVSFDDTKEVREALLEIINDLNAKWQNMSLFLQYVDWYQDPKDFFLRLPTDAATSPLVDRADVYFAIFWKSMGPFLGDITSDEASKYRVEKEVQYVCQRSQQKQTPSVVIAHWRKAVTFDTASGAELEEFLYLGKFIEKIKDDYQGSTLAFSSISDFQVKAYNALETVLQATQLGIERNEMGALGRWLQDLGLTINPFSHPQASSDENLRKYFYNAPYFDQIAGRTPNVPPPAAIIGKVGTGKTAIRQMVQHFSGQANRKILTVPYTQFTKLIELLNERKAITAAQHIERILLSAVDILSEAVSSSKTKLLPGTSTSACLELWKYIEHYGKGLKVHQKDAIRVELGMDNGAGLELSLPDDPIQIYYGFCEAVRILGFESVFVLVDQVDEGDLASDDEKIVELIGPLMRANSVLDMPQGLGTFRFFLPERLEAPLKKSGVRLRDRITVYPLEWPPDKLKELIRLRLNAASEQIVYESMDQLSSVPNLDARLVEAAKGNPRTLINLCSRMIDEHCNSHSSDDTSLDEEDFQKALKALESPSIETLPRSTYSPIDSLPSPLAVLAAKYLHEGGNAADKKVWSAFKFAQITIQFCTCTLLSLYIKQQMNNELNEHLQRLLFNPSRPPSLGDWQQACNRLIKVVNQDLTVPFDEVLRYKDLQKNFNKLIELRNNVAHGRLSNLATQTLNEVEEAVQVLFKALKPLSGLEFVSVESVDVNDEGHVLHHVRLHKGNVVQPSTEDVQFVANYPKHSLLLYTSSEDSVKLSPFIIFECATQPTLTSREIFLYEQTYQSRDGQTIIQYTNPVTDHILKNENGDSLLTKYGFLPLIGS
jgi:hypothetical protein